MVFIAESWVRRLMKLRVLRTRRAWDWVLVQPAPIPFAAWAWRAGWECRPGSGSPGAAEGGPAPVVGPSGAGACLVA
jgi:hypothetical protein